MSKLAFISIIKKVGWGGSEELWALAAEEALKAGHEVGIFIFEWRPLPPKLKKLEDMGAKVFHRKRSYKRARVLNLYFNRLAKIPPKYHLYPSFKALQKFNPDAICITDSGTWESFGFPDLIGIIRYLRKPYVVISQANAGFHLPPEREDASRFFKEAYSIAFVSEHNKLLAEHQLASTIPNSVVLQNPVNMKDLSVVPWPETNGLARLAMVARLSSEKGQDILFRILSRPQWQEREYKLTLYGEGFEKSYLEKLSKYYKISHKVEFAGQVQDIRSIWKENHIYVLPTHIEGTPLSMLEAMVCGRPAVVSNAGGTAEWVRDGVTGFIAEAATENLFAEVLEKAWNSKDNWKTMGKQAREEAIKKFNPSPGTPLLKIILEAASSR